MNNKVQNKLQNTIKKRPVSTFIITLLIIVFLLATTSVLKIDLCNKDFISNLYSNFIHFDILHLLSNIYGIYVLSRIEEKIGYEKFILLITILVIINTIFETILHKIIDTKCSIGFSAILYGMFSWGLFSGCRNIDYHIVIAVIFDMISSKINTNISLVSHFIGFLSGIITANFLKYDL
jgi:membrane associated rhomboid family serine protease